MSRSRPGAMTMGKMAANELFHHRLIKLAHWQMLCRQPAGEMLGNLSVRLNDHEHVTARLQIEGEIIKNYAEMAGSHPAANKRTAK